MNTRPPAIVAFIRAGGPSTPPLDTQRRHLEAAGATITFSAASGPFANCLPHLHPGDLLMVTAADRLAATASDLVAVMSELMIRGVRVTVSPLNGQQVELVTPAVRPVIATLAAMASPGPAGPSPEAVARRLAGIAAAKAAGRFTGRRPTIRAEDVRNRLQTGASAAAVARELGIGRSSVYRCRAASTGQRDP